jgi:hypothetical protein
MTRTCSRPAAPPFAHTVVAMVTGAAMLAVALVSLPAAARAAQEMQGTVWLLGALPQGEFKEKVEKDGFGIGGSFAFRIPESPVYAGAELNYAVYGQARYDEYFPGTAVRVNVQTDNSIMQGLLLLRLQAPPGPVRPYVDGLFGFHYLFTTTTIKNRSSQEDIASDTNLDDTALAYGGGGGIMFRLWHPGPASDTPRLRSVMLDLRARYVAGAEAKYLKEGTILVVNNQLVYRLQRSRTDLVTVGAGVTFEF